MKDRSGSIRTGIPTGARLEAVITTAAMDEAARSALCRKHGVYPAELAKWRSSATAALAEPEEARASPQATRQDRKRITELERDLLRKDRALAETTALLVLSKGSRRFSKEARTNDRPRRSPGTCLRHPHSPRRWGAAAPGFLACEVAGIDERTLQRWKARQGLVAGDARPQAVRPPSSHVLSADERGRLLEVANEPRFAAVPPARIVPMLADEGVYLASESSFARVLRQQGQNAHRGRAKAPRAVRSPTTHIATAPRQVWCWDMTYLPAAVLGRWFHLYLVLDLYSRKIVGWEVHDSDDSAHAVHLVQLGAHEWPARLANCCRIAGNPSPDPDPSSRRITERLLSCRPCPRFSPSC